jgi:ATP-binding cassette subfamily C protein
MLKAVKASLAFMTPKERSKWYFLTGLRALLSLLDLVGILAIGFVVTSTAIFLASGSSPDRSIQIAGILIPAVTAQTLPVVGAGILATFLIKASLAILITRKTAFFVAKIEARAAKQIAERVFNGDLVEAKVRSREEMSFAIQFGSPAAFNHLLNFTSTVAAEATLFVVICLGFVLVDPVVTLAAIAYFAIIALVMQYFVGTLMARAGVKAAEGTIEANGAVGDLISVFRELSVLGLRHKYIDRIYKSRIAAADSAAAQTYLNSMPRYIIESALLVGVAAFILAQALAGDIVASAATIGVFLSGGFRLTAAMLPFQSALLSIKGYLPSAKTAHEILQEPKHTSNEEKILAPQTKTAECKSQAVRVKFDSISFSYAGALSPTLDNLAFEISPGEQVALIGASGAGKSTIADLMCGVLSPSRGSVSLTPSKEKDPVHKVSVSYVPQKPGLVSGTISENVALGIDKSQVDESLVHESLALAHLTEVVSNLPERINTNLGKYQDVLSGGQIQRLGLARALYSNPGLLVMDEATSALDAESESEIAKALNQIRGKITVVLIAHRLNTVQHADRVFLIDSGKVLDQGTFQELVSRNPSVERLVQLMKVDNS